MNKDRLNWLMELTKVISDNWEANTCDDHIEIYDGDRLLVCWLPVVTKDTIYNAEFICLAREMMEQLLEEKK
jgi:hypothetical protein